MREMITVGAGLSLSGQFAVQGRQAERGLRLWAEDLNAAGGLRVRDRGGPAPIELTVCDDESRSARSAKLTERLIVEERVDLLIGPYSSVLALAAAPVAERRRKVLWNHGGATDALGTRGFRFVVTLLSPASRYFAGLLAMARDLWPPAQRVALLYGAAGTFPRAVIGGAEAHAARLGFEVVLEAAYPALPGGMATLADTVAAQRPDVILGVGTTEADLALARQLVDRPLEARVVGLVAAPIELFRQELGTAAEGFVGPSQWEPAASSRPDIGPSSAEFVARFRARFATEPDYPAAQAYAAGLVAQRCAELAGTLDDEALRREASRLALTTFYGDFKLDPATGEQVGHRVLVVQWQAGVRRVVWPPAVAEAAPRPWRPA